MSPYIAVKLILKIGLVFGGCLVRQKGAGWPRCDKSLSQRSECGPTKWYGSFVTQRSLLAGLTEARRDREQIDGQKTCVRRKPHFRSVDEMSVPVAKETSTREMEDVSSTCSDAAGDLEEGNILSMLYGRLSQRNHDWQSQEMQS